MHINTRSVGFHTALALASVYLAWGGTYPAIRVMVETVPPLLGTAARFLVAGVVMAAVLLALGRLRATRRELIGAAAVGTVILGDIGVLAVAEQVGRRTVLAVLAGLGGMTLLVSPGGEAPLLWLLVLVVAAAVEAAGQFWSQRVELPADPLASTTIQLLAAGLALAIAGLALGEAGDVRPGAFSADSLWAFAYLVVPGSLVAYTAFVWLLRNAPIRLVATYAYVNPVVAVAIGALLLGENVTPAMAAGGALILGSVALTSAPASASRAT